MGFVGSILIQAADSAAAAGAGAADSAAARDTAAGLDAGQQLLVIGFALLLVVLLVLTGWMLLRLTEALREGDLPRIESHWGGIGGGLGGWQLSRSLAWLLAVVTFASLLVFVFNQGVGTLRAERQAARAHALELARAHATRPDTAAAGGARPAPPAPQRPDTTGN